MKKLVGITLIIVIVIIFGSCTSIDTFMKDKIITTPDLTLVKDGTYKGTVNTFPVCVTLSVDVLDHHMTDLKMLSHFNGPGHSAEAIFPSVLEAQSLDVDAISGATMSSAVTLKAIQIALEKGIDQE